MDDLTQRADQEIESKEITETLVSVVVSYVLVAVSIILATGFPMFFVAVYAAMILIPCVWIIYEFVRFLDIFFFFSQVPSREEEHPDALRFRRQIKSAPGSLLLRFVTFWFSARNVEHVLRPAIEDLRLEYYEALQAGYRMKARWVRFRGTIAVLKAAGLLQMVSFAKLLVRLWKVVG